MTYAEAQQDIDAGTSGSLGLLKEVGELRQELERERGGMSLHVPEQEITKHGSDYRLSYRAPLPVEDWNAQISLMTGMAGAEIMLQGKVGLLRTMPAPTEDTVARLRRSAVALGLEWPDGMSYPEFVRTLDARIPTHAAVVTQATRLFRGVEYVGFNGNAPVDAQHHAIAAPYAHVTAPLRRLGDRYASEIILSIQQGQTPPSWCIEALGRLPEEMKEGDRRDGELERRIVDFVEAVILEDRAGDIFDAVVVEVNKKGGTIQLFDPAVLASCDGRLPLGAKIRAKLAEVDPRAGSLKFQHVE
jgi:exoribonuclease R